MRLRVLTYNIRSGTDLLGRPRLAEQAAVVRGAAADLVLLQEVACADQAHHLADLAGLRHVVFGATRRSRAGEFGNAMLCRWPLDDLSNRPVAGGWLPSEPRAVLSATLTCGGHSVHALASHFGLLPGEAERAARTVLAIAADRPGPLVVGGDFNRPVGAAACHRLLRNAFSDCARLDGRVPEPTFPSAGPVLRLDYLYMRDLLLRDMRVVPSSASDHRPILAEFSLPAA